MRVSLQEVKLVAAVSLDSLGFTSSFMLLEKLHVNSFIGRRAPIVDVQVNLIVSIRTEMN